MELLQETTEFSKKSFIGHVFSTSDESKAELLNVIQYAGLGIIPVVMLNKLISRFVPEADPDKSNIELIIEIILQLIILLGGVVLIHRIITFVPTYSGFKYEGLCLTNCILLFLVIVLSIESKMSLKMNILLDRLYEMWNGGSSANSRNGGGPKNRMRPMDSILAHSPSQGDNLDSSSAGGDVFPPMASSKSMNGGNMGYDIPSFSPMPASSLLGGLGGMF
jgi:hypothetical protein